MKLLQRISGSFRLGPAVEFNRAAPAPNSRLLGRRENYGSETRATPIEGYFLCAIFALQLDPCQELVRS